jgi:N-acetylmuramoyl-L-alanine amidase
MTNPTSTQTQTSGVANGAISKLLAADQMARKYGDNQSISAPIQNCPLDTRYAVEVCIVDREGHPIANVPLGLGKSESEVLYHKTGPHGIARFNGLAESTYQLELCEADRRLWQLARTETLTPPEQLGSGMAVWQDRLTSACEAKKIHEVSQGECILMLASRFGHLPETLWAANKDKFPAGRSMAILAPGDKLVIPARQAGSISVAIGCRYHIVLGNAITKFAVRFLDSFQNPYKDCDYLVNFITDDGALPICSSGKTDQEGFVRESILPGVVRGELRLRTPQGRKKYRFDLGALDPISEDSGAIHRLNNLGFYCSENDPLSVRGAIAAFQLCENLDVTGERDAATRTKLKERHFS